MTKRIAVTKFQYISYLVNEIKQLHDNNQDYNWYFNELVELYNPLIRSACKKVYEKLRDNRDYQELRTRVLEIFFDAIIKYKKTFKDGRNANSFKHVYFGSYLKGKLPWDLMRLVTPPKVEYDEITMDHRNMELDLENCSNEVEFKLSTEKSIGKVTKPLSDNFISLCRIIQKQLRSDMIADVMILFYGYGYKNREIAQMLNCSPQKVSIAISEIKKFWRENKEIIFE